jgi:hypothetical protein
MVKFKFKIFTRNRVLVDKLVIGAKDFDGARIKLEKMYPHCEIVESQEDFSNSHKASFDEILDLITKG